MTVTAKAKPDSAFLHPGLGKREIRHLLMIGDGLVVMLTAGGTRGIPANHLLESAFMIVREWKQGNAC